MKAFKEVIYDVIHYAIVIGGLLLVFLLNYQGKDSSGLSSVVCGVVAVGGANFFRIRAKRNSRAMGGRTALRQKEGLERVPLDDGKGLDKIP